MRALADRGYAQSIYGPLYAELFGPGGLAVAASAYMAVEEAVRLIRDCGGYPVLAHPFMYDSLELVPALVRRGLAGIECWRHTQTPERERLAREKAGRYGLFLTGGSDFHGLYSEKPLPRRVCPGSSRLPSPGLRARGLSPAPTSRICDQYRSPQMCQLLPVSLNAGARASKGKQSMVSRKTLRNCS